ncbi:MAG: mechanosensitive ion channel domain-containing protein [Myxococcota bacterium]
MTGRPTTRRRGSLMLGALLGVLLGVSACRGGSAEVPASGSAAAPRSSVERPSPAATAQSDPIAEIFEEPSTGTPAGAAEPAAARELRALRTRLSFPRGLFFPLVLMLAWGVSRAAQRVTRFVLRLGVEHHRLVNIAGDLVSLGAWVLAFVVIAVRLLRAAPTLTLGVLTLLAVASMAVLRRQLENLAAGVTLAVRGRLREGDRIAMAEHHGVVRRVSFTHVELHQADGSLLYLPNRLVGTEVVAIGPARYSVPLQISLRRDHPWSAEEIRRARLLAGLSPYRDPSGQVVVEAGGGGEHRLSVQMQVWSPRLVAAAEEHLRRQLDRHVAHGPGLASDGDRRQGERRTHERRGL